MNKEQFITLIENNKLDEAFKQFISLARGTELYTNFLMPLYIEYQEYLDDKLAGKNVSGKLADISQRLMRILEKYQETTSSNPINTNTKQNNTNMMDKKTLIKLLQDAYDAAGIDMFCYMNVEFEKAHGNIESLSTKDRKIIELLKFCEQNLLIERLLQVIKEEKPAMYQKYIK